MTVVLASLLADAINRVLAEDPVSGAFIAGEVTLCWDHNTDDYILTTPLTPALVRKEPSN